MKRTLAVGGIIGAALVVGGLYVASLTADAGQAAPPPGPGAADCPMHDGEGPTQEMLQRMEQMHPDGAMPGPGASLEEMRQHMTEVHGADFAEEMLQQMEQMHSGGTMMQPGGGGMMGSGGMMGGGGMMGR